MTSPRITIGVTTFDRTTLLQECLRSLMTQSFQAWHVLLGNDNPKRTLSVTALGLDDRFTIINRSVNLGELANMNDLLDRATTPYFTWLADDDAYHPEFLHTMMQAMQDDPTLDVVFSNYWSGATYGTPPCSPALPARIYAPGELLDGYLSQRIRLIGCYEVYKTAFLKQLGGMPATGQVRERMNLSHV